MSWFTWYCLDSSDIVLILLILLISIFLGEVRSWDEQITTTTTTAKWSLKRWLMSLEIPQVYSVTLIIFGLMYGFENYGVKVMLFWRKKTQRKFFIIICWNVLKMWMEWMSNMKDYTQFINQLDFFSPFNLWILS